MSRVKSGHGLDYTGVLTHVAPFGGIMRAGRLILVVATLVAIIAFPIFAREALRLPSAYAAPQAYGGVEHSDRVYQDDNDNVTCYLSLNSNEEVPCEFDDNGNINNNDNVTCYLNLNSNEEVPCDFTDDNGDAESAPPPAPGFMPPSRRCFAAQEVGDVRLVLEGGSVTVQVVPPSGLPQVTWVQLDDVEDRSGLPALPAGAAIVDGLVWRLAGGSPCDGPAAGQLPGPVNLGIPYHVPANKPRLQIYLLQGGQWVEVPTVPDPDPNNPYISATIRQTGIYAVGQRP
jgi:hypothetical protein